METKQSNTFRIHTGGVALKMPIQSPAVPPPKPAPRFSAHHVTVFHGTREVGRMISKTMAKRTANALNNHKPNSEGV